MSENNLKGWSDYGITTVKAKGRVKDPEFQEYLRSLEVLRVQEKYESEYQEYLRLKEKYESEYQEYLRLKKKYEERCRTTYL